MTENQLLAIDELRKIEELLSRCRLLQLKADSLLEEISLKAAWPAVGTVPGLRHKRGYEDPYIERKERKNNPDYAVYAFEPTASRKSHPDTQLITSIDKKLALERQIDEVNGQIQMIEEKILATCDQAPAEVLLRRFVFGQRWRQLASEMKMSEATARGHYYAGLEQYGMSLRKK